MECCAEAHDVTDWAIIHWLPVPMQISTALSLSASGGIKSCQAERVCWLDRVWDVLVVGRPGRIKA